jgi:hypothetical protein
LKLVLERFRIAKLKLRPKKCLLFQKTVKFLGHWVSQEGIKVDQEKIAVITSWEFPKNKTELRTFMGMSQYYRCYCQNYSVIAAPLNEMLKNDQKVEPTEER